jgi:hypothetical protein
MAARLSSILLLGLLAALLVGCGGDTRRAETETEATEAPQPSAAAPQQPAAEGAVRVTRITDPGRRAYVDRVDAICGRVDPERTNQQERVGAAPDTTEAVKAYDDTIALGWRELRMIEAVPPPPGDKELLKANIFDPVRSQLELRAQMSQALAASEVSLLRRLRAELDNSTRAMTGFARGYGFRVCGEA